MKRVVIVRDDSYHPKEVIDPFILKLFKSDEWEVILTDTLRDLLALTVAVDLTMLFNTGRNEGQADITHEEQLAVVKRVEAGMGMMFIHAGTVLIQEDSPFYQVLNSGRFIHHSQGHLPVVTEPIKNMRHPILTGINKIEAFDEHYFCTVNIAAVDLLMISTSRDVSSIGAWSSEHGQGRIFTALPGHTPSALGNAEMQKLLSNGIKWTTHQTI